MDIDLLISHLKSDNDEIKQRAIATAKSLRLTEKQLLIQKSGGLEKLNALFSSGSVQTKNVKLPSFLKVKKKEVPSKPIDINYGVYTVSDYNFFAGTVANINSLRYHGYKSDIAVIDIGFNDWMVNYLNQYEGVRVLSLNKLRKLIRFTDVNSDEEAVMKGWAYKAFGIIHYDLFDAWTFIDADFLPLCNLEEHMLPLIKKGKFVSTEDGTNEWGKKHQDAIGVEPGVYSNINAGFISVNMFKHGWVIHEWRNLMTRRKPFDLWYGDQGALNAILDKHNIEKTTVDKRLWNQTWLNEKMAKAGVIIYKNGKPFHKEIGKPIMAWHGVGWHKLWHQIGIDYYRRDKADREKFHKECQGKSPSCIVEEFRKMLFLGDYNKPLKQNGHLLRV